MGRRRNEGPTPREQEVLCLLARGMSNNEIAEALVISIHTVEKHLASIYDKLGVTRRAQAVRWVFEHAPCDEEKILTSRHCIDTEVTDNAYQEQFHQLGT
ncbi:MAG: helix-turn-helix transcriptional regulator [Caldilineaceae bacterium]|nr:helix-turn-helix transcriptional regulator [Caldilineaceae bacterium]